MKPEPNIYHSYLLRLWQVQGVAGVDWRASLEVVQTGELQGFSDLASLLSYLKSETFSKQDDEKVLGLQSG